MKPSHTPYGTYTVGEYESGWYIERADHKDIEKMVQVKGPFGTEMEAKAAARELEAICREVKKRPAPKFTYRCTNCQTKNKTQSPPEDCMLHCSRCGFLTVQCCDRVEARLG